MREAVDVVLNCLLVEVEHGIVRVEQLLDEELEEFLPHTTFIHSWLPLEDDPHWFLEIKTWLHDDIKGIIKNKISLDLKHQIECPLAMLKQLHNVKLVLVSMLINPVGEREKLRLVGRVKDPWKRANSEFF